MERFSARLHGIGGQGLKSMIQDILAPIILEAGLEIQAFPFFGGERRGAPVSGYFRCGSGKITTHSFITEPDMAVIFDHERISAAAATDGLRPNGIVLVNTSLPKQFMGFTHKWQVYSVNARKISLAHQIGRPEDPFMIINSAMAGAMLGILESVLEKKFSDETVRTVLENALAQKADKNYEALSDGKRTVAKLLADASPMWQWFPNYFESPHLTQPDERCSRCNICYIFCPKRAIEITGDGAYFINKEKCNYCGICVNVCPKNAISIAVGEGGTSHE